VSEELPVATEADRRVAEAVTTDLVTGARAWAELQERIAVALAEERRAARAQVASDLADLVTDSGDVPSRGALADFIYGLES
jgi:hypothetical protein